MGRSCEEWFARLRRSLSDETGGGSRPPARGSRVGNGGEVPAVEPDGRENDDDSWGAVHDAPQLLPGALVGRRIVISAKGREGRAWTAKVLVVLERTSDRVVVRDTKPPWVKSPGE